MIQNIPYKTKIKISVLKLWYCLNRTRKGAVTVHVVLCAFAVIYLILITAFSLIVHLIAGFIDGVRVWTKHISHNIPRLVKAYWNIDYVVQESIYEYACLTPEQTD